MLNVERITKPLFLPPYSPEINPEEYVHNYLRNKTLNNCNFMGIKQIGIVIANFIRRMDQKMIRSIVPLAPIEALLSVK